MELNRIQLKAREQQKKREKHFNMPGVIAETESAVGKHHSGKKTSDKQFEAIEAPATHQQALTSSFA
jgi:hypothetical protein